MPLEAESRGFIVGRIEGSLSSRNAQPMTSNPGGSKTAAELDPQAVRMEALRSELVAVLERRTGSDGGHETAIPELKLYRFSQPTEPAHFLQEPAVYVVVQGRKQVTLDDATYIYDRS